MPSSSPSESPFRKLAAACLLLDDDELCRQCRTDVFVASGPGGQHRNKTESGVRLTHEPTGLVVTATERRSQLQNRSVALQRLREKLRSMSVVPKDRRATRPTRGSQRRRLDQKKRHSEIKRNRGRTDGDA